jgi:hypothetical protein
VLFGLPTGYCCHCTAATVLPQAVEQYEAIREKEREQLEELEAARRESRAATEAFQTVQQSRYDAFTAAFEHVAQRIDPIYKVGTVWWLSGWVGWWVGGSVVRLVVARGQTVANGSRALRARKSLLAAETCVGVWVSISFLARCL